MTVTRGPAMPSPATEVALFVMLAMLATSAMPRAQCSTAWLAGSGLPGVDGTIYAMTSWDPDGAGPQPALLVLGGDFTVAGDRATQGLAAYEPTTGTWSTFGAGIGGTPVAGFRPVVRSLLARASGELVVGGWFTTAGGAPASCIASWNGTAWSALGSGLGTSQPYPAANSFGVRALAEDPAGDLIVGGQFTTAGGVAAANVARWTPAGWAAMAGGIPGASFQTAVNALARLPNGEWIAGGLFGLGSGLARWNGTGWSAFHGLSAGAEVYALHLRPNGELVVAGKQLVYVAGQPISAIAAWNGATWSSLGGGLGYYPAFGNGTGTALATLANGDLAVVGEFESAGTTLASNAARWDGLQWHAMGATPRSRNLDGGIDLALQCLAIDPAGTCWLGGRFHRAGTRGLASLARWTGSLWDNAGTGINRAVRAMLRHSDGSWWLAGDFTTFGNVATGVGGIARFDGVAWSFLNGGVAGGTWTQVHDLCELPDGSVLAVGDFESAGGVPARNAARWQAGTWLPFATGLGNASGDYLERVWVQPGGAVWVTGQVALGSQTVGWAIAMGGVWIGPPFAVQHLRLLASDGAGRVAATGTVGSQSGVFEWNGAWSFLGALQPNSPFGPFGGVVDALYTPTGDLVVTGFFTSVGGTSADNVAIRRNAVWQAFGSGLPSNVFPAQGVGLAPNGDVVVVRTQPDAVMRWNGATWDTLAGPLQGIAATRPRLLADGGALWLASQYSAAGGVVSANLARIGSTCPAAVAVAGAGCPGSGGSNVLTAATPPWLGSTFTLRGSALPNQALVAALTSLRTAAVPLAGLFPVAGPGCTLLVGSELVEYVPATAGSATWSVTIPLVPALVGLSLSHQFLPFEFVGGTLVAVTATNSLQSTLGIF